MKKDLHISIENYVLSDLNQMSDKMKINRSALIESIIVKGMQDIERLNYNFTQFINK